MPVGRVSGGGGGWIFDADDLVALRIAAGTSPSVYFEVGGGDGKSNEPVVTVVDEAASDDGLDWLCWWWWWCSFNKRIRHQSGALGKLFLNDTNVLSFTYRQFLWTTCRIIV